MIPTELKQKLSRNALDYSLVPSDSVPKTSGLIIAIENYYPNDKNDISLSIALACSQDSWEAKCWLSVMINDNSSNRPIYNRKYQEFCHNSIHYYPYSVQTGSYKLTEVIKLCDGLYKYAQTYTKK